MLQKQTLSHAGRTGHRHRHRRGGQTRLAEIARITAAQAQTVAQTEADKVIQTATIARDGEIQTATIERDRTIEIARITSAVQTAQKSEEESIATAAANEARAGRPGRGMRRHRQGDRNRETQQRTSP